MNIKAEIKQVLDGTRSTKAFADVIIDNAVVIHGVRLCEKDGSKYISMPYEKWTDKNGEEKRRDVAHPISSPARYEIQSAVIAAFTAAQTADTHYSEEGGNENA